jgi:hypothetical protein
MAKIAFCIVPGHTQAVKVVDELKSAGIPNQNISVLLSDKSSSTGFAKETQTRTPEAGALAGAKVGGLLGGTLGLLVGIGTLAIPAVGTFIAAGPIMGALRGAAFGVAVGGMSGTLVGLGLTELESKRYETRLKAGNVLVSVHLDAPEQTQRVRDIFPRAGAEDISISSEARLRDEKQAGMPAAALKS